MVLQKRLYYGFNGFQAPAMPRGSRSARGKRSVRNTIKRDQMCAFELLATVAGKLLLEEESPSQINSAAGEFKSPTGKSNDKQEKHDARIPKVEPCDQGSCDEGALPLETRRQRLSQKFALKECSQASNSVVLEPASVLKSETSGRNNYGLAIDASKGNTGDSLAIVRQGCSDQRQSPYSAESHVVKMEDGISALLQADLHRGGNGLDGIVSDLLCTEDPQELDSKSPTLVSSDSSVELSPYRDHISRCSSFPNCRDDMELIGRDDDENSSRCTLPSAITSKAFRPQRIGGRRIRKFLASKFWKVGPTLLNDGEFSNIEAETKSIFRSRKMCYTRQRTQRSFKRRKLFQRSSTFTHAGEISNEFLSMSPEKIMKGEPSSPAATLHGGQKSQLKPDDYQVKFSIKSFKLPELFIEMSESATVGELKRTVLETMTAILRNGLRVGVILQGKKIRDDSKTLFQTGISHGAKLDSLGFSLEPNSSQIPQLAVPEDPPHLLDPCDSHKPLSWLPAVPSAIEAQPDRMGPSVTTDLAESELNMASSTKTILPEKTTGDSGALAPAVSMEALAVVSVHRKSKRSELVQRRIRRPFSVTEVEALVQAVEKLGTGRWRDVKLRAFDNAKHRTYVDLKDKWKTLVHTARISPQQRRGEPVPQELLDRVLSAHAYWSQQQAKLHIKQQPDQCLHL